MNDNNHDIINLVNEPSTPYTGFVQLSEDEKLLHDALRPDIEKLQLFTKMIRRNATLNKAVISINPSK